MRQKLPNNAMSRIIPGDKNLPTSNKICGPRLELDCNLFYLNTEDINPQVVFAVYMFEITATSPKGSKCYQQNLSQFFKGLKSYPQDAPNSTHRLTMWMNN